MKNEFKNNLEKLLKQDVRVWDEEQNEINQTKLLDLVRKYDEKLMGLFLEDEDITQMFFVKIKDVYVFKYEDFKFFIEEHAPLANSYTEYKNQIGLAVGKRFLKDSEDVVLNFPFKDCVLEGGQSSEDGQETYFEFYENTVKEDGLEKIPELIGREENISVVKDKKTFTVTGFEKKTGKRKEIFFNEILGKDEIDRLLDEKAFVNFKRFTKNGVEKVEEIKRDAEGTIRENLIIKGNNLLALHSLKSQFTGKVKLIYIDPPYNTGNDSFAYNDNFNHSTWLTFMKNRLEVARELLRDDGVIFIHCDYNEQAYLKLIVDEVFKDNFISMITVKTSTESGVKVNANKPIKVSEYILMIAKNKELYTYNKVRVQTSYDGNYSYFVENPNEDFSKWKIKNIKEAFLEKNNNFNAENLNEILLEKFQIKYKNNIFSVRDISDNLKLYIKNNNINKEEVTKYVTSTGKETLLYKNGEIVFISKKIFNIDGKEIITKIASDLWIDIKWDGIAKEGNIVLKNGKKPEKLIKRILETSTVENDIVLDYHLGSGTTAAVAHKMKRQYIGIEQLDYGKNDSVVRLQNVINGDQTGISKDVNWNGGGDFIYFELAKHNELAKEKIMEAKSVLELISIFDDLCKNYFLDYNLKIKDFREMIKEDKFLKLKLDEQKLMFTSMLDLNQMYVNFSDMEDVKFGIGKEDRKLTRGVYEK